MKDKQIYDFSAVIERLDGDWAWDFVEVPPSIVEEIRTKKWKRLCVALEELTAHSCALLPLSEGRRGIMISQARQKELGIFLGAWIHLRVWEDQSKYGMPVPKELQELFEFDPAIEAAFEKLLPGPASKLPSSHCLRQDGGYSDQTRAEAAKRFGHRKRGIGV